MPVEPNSSLTDDYVEYGPDDVEITIANSLSKDAVVD